MNLYKKLTDKYGWCLYDLDNTNFDTLMAFVWYKDKPDPNVRVINGKTYTRATGAPNWL